MKQYLIKRLLGLIPVLFGVLFLVGTMTRLVPGDPASVILGELASDADKKQLRIQLGLEDHILKQLGSYSLGLLRGDLGESLLTRRPVKELIKERLRPTAELALISLLIALMLALPLGILSALRRNTWIDYAAMSFALSGVAMPGFCLGPILVLVFAVKLEWLPVSERGGLLSYVLPAFTMGLGLSAALARMTRNTLLDIMHEDFIRTARAKGASKLRLLLQHALPNAALPLITVLGLQFGVLLSGAVISEKIFDWPGVGSLIMEALLQRDYPVVQGCVLFFSLSYLLVNLLTDLLYAWVDPRIKWDGA